MKKLQEKHDNDTLVDGYYTSDPMYFLTLGTGVSAARPRH